MTKSCNFFFFFIFFQMCRRWGMGHGQSICWYPTFRGTSMMVSKRFSISFRFSFANHGHYYRLFSLFISFLHLFFHTTSLSPNIFLSTLFLLHGALSPPLLFHSACGPGPVPHSDPLLSPLNLSPISIHPLISPYLPSPPSPPLLSSPIFTGPFSWFSLLPSSSHPHSFS